MDNIQFCINEIGNNGPFILLLSTIYLLWNHKMLIYYICGFFVNIILNLILKIIIKDPRPSLDKSKFLLALRNSNLIKINMLGMPSGHAQSVLYSSSFIFFVLQKWVPFYLFISIVTIFQRVKFNYHTILQVIIGSIIGSFFAYLVFYLAKNKLKGSMKSKTEDNGPI